MIKIILNVTEPLAPFNEPARELRILDKPLWLHHRDILAPYTHQEREIPFRGTIAGSNLPETNEETLVYKDNLYFDDVLFSAFLQAAQRRSVPSQIAFRPDDKAIVQHALPLQSSIRRHGEVYVADLYYFPHGYSFQALSNAEPLVIDTLPQEVGYYHVPTYMAYEKGDLVYQVPQRPFLSIENWVHIFLANTAFGIYSMGVRIEDKLDKSLPFMLKIFVRSLIERKQFLESSPLVKVGKNCQIDPAAIIQGPTIIGNNVTIGAGCVVNACVIGDNVNISQGCQLMASVIGSGSFLPFRASLFMTTLMENAMVAQNTCLQMCVVGRNTFIGAGNTFTDFNLLGKPIRTMHRGRLEEVKQPVLGGCVGHNCRIGSGHIIFPGRTIESDVVLFAQPGRHIIAKNITYAESDHHHYPDERHIPLYHPAEKETTAVKE
ncbi:MAG: multidrug transporter [Caldilineae bacterium]|nr:MAG: multidrug transporter [Caldilineae bacterium]